MAEGFRRRAIAAKIAAPWYMSVAKPVMKLFGAFCLSHIHSFVHINVYVYVVRSMCVVSFFICVCVCVCVCMCVCVCVCVHVCV